MLNQSSSGGIGGERDVHDMTAGAAKGETPTAKHIQRLGEMHGVRHPARRTKGLPLCQAAGALAFSANTSRTSRTPDGAFNGQEARGGGGGAQPSPTPTWLAWLWQGVTIAVTTVLVFALCCLVLVCPPLLWSRQRAIPFALLESYRSKPSRLSEVRASRCPAGRRAPGGRTVGGVRRASLLLLVPWLAVCTAAGTICSNKPTVCDGTYSGTQLYLYSNSLTGSLPTQLGALTALTWINLYRNSLTGSLPTQLGALTALTYMSLRDNSLTGSLPTQLGALTALTRMFLTATA
jgi:hypothetical protein